MLHTKSSVRLEHAERTTTRTAGTKPSVPSGRGGGGGTRMHRLLGCCTLENWLGSVDAQ